ncbi:hypothetical protein GQ53DRAFT_543289 [Thozetella sp. PMI_491]|nr:hypothetical protein GQ53DRAFT_543289 [Thozetella sp. PMI_491]
MESSQEFQPMQERIQRALVATTKTVNELANQDLQFQRTANPSAGAQLDTDSDRLLRIATGLLSSAGKATKQRVPSVEDAEDIDISWRGIVDVIDTLLEKADTCLDEYTGLLKRKEAPTVETAPMAKRYKTNQLDSSLKRANIVKPQTHFERKIDNWATGPWEPLLTSKPHSIVALEDSLVTFTDENQNLQYKHPYETEIVQLQYPTTVHEQREPIKYLPVDSTSATWVDTYEGVLEMLEELKKAREIAIDLEHHDYRSYAGLLSLMQISTRDKDWIVDTLRPWRHKLEILNEVFADPGIIKILHGAYMDIIWLQRDLGLYIVGLFDTYYASDALEYQAKSLAYLLKRFADFDADKKYQLADWRIRPLPQEMLYYARSDTHYLLYIYDMVRNELLRRSDQNDSDRNLVDWVIEKSKEVSLQRYENPITDPEAGSAARGWFNFLIKTPELRTAEQLSVYKAIYKWRDHRARQEDENPIFIMQQMVLADIAKVVPTDQKALWSLLGSQARSLKPHLDEIFALVQEAKEKGRDGPTVAEVLRSSATGSTANKALEARLSKPLARGEDAGLPQLVQADLPDIAELRIQHSQLFGNVPVSSKHEKLGGDVLSARQPEDISVPWLQFVQDVRTTEATIKESSPVEEHPPSHDEVGIVVQDQEFNLKGGRRHNHRQGDARSRGDRGDGDSDLEIIDDALLSSGDDGGEQSLAEAEAEGEPGEQRKDAGISKEEAKKLKRAKRKERREKKAVIAGENRQTNSSATVQHDIADDEVFDYSKAQSILHADRAKGTGPKKGVKIFDPYSKVSAGAPQGAKQLNYEKAGKTATFKK